ncbi:MAG: PIN domain-containing protein [Segniliparus sp.]|uniref:PIN domain-containing protein n=1 Tax=Segniliparus sp. TaxID=2804064 RepID=UPI003F316B31
MSVDGRAGYTLDAGALIAFERGDERIRKLIARAVRQRLPLHVPATALAQAWRGGPRQARLSRLLASGHVGVPVLDEQAARRVGLLCGKSRHHDIVDVHVAVDAREHRHQVVTSDPDDLRRVDPGLGIVEI